MNLRKKLADSLQLRLQATVPDMLDSAWDSTGLAVLIESLKFNPSSADQVDFSGTARAMLRLDHVDDYPIDKLVFGLVKAPLHINAPNAKCRGVLVELRDSVDEVDINTSLRFEIDGVFYLKTTITATPDQPHLGHTPLTGPGHKDKYLPVESLPEAVSV